jgi:hypothetical protein
LPTNIRLGWKGQTVTNALAYYKTELSAVVKSLCLIQWTLCSRPLKSYSQRQRKLFPFFGCKRSLADLKLSRNKDGGINWKMTVTMVGLLARRAGIKKVLPHLAE